MVERDGRRFRGVPVKFTWKEINMDWLPIETAPKDKRILLGFSRPVFTGVRVIFWQWEPDEYALKPRPYWSHDLVHLAGRIMTRENQPTHWMPAPGGP